MDGLPGPKRRVELELDAELVARAERLSGDFGGLLESALRRHVEASELRQAEARAHAAATNALVERHGVWGAEFSTL